MIPGKQQTDIIPLGTYTRVLDQKFRITVPGIWREAPLIKNDAGFITYKNPARLILIPPDRFSAMNKKNFRPVTRKEKEDVRRLLASAFSVQLDGRGRITIPAEFVHVLGLKAGKNLVVTATGGWVEIWREEDWLRGKGIPGLFGRGE